MKRILTAAEEHDIAVWYVVGVPIKDITETFNISRSGVNRVVKRLGVSVNRGKRSK